MIKFTCRLCRQTIRDENWCDNCLGDQYKANGAVPIKEQQKRQAELDAFAKDIGEKVKAVKAGYQPPTKIGVTVDDILNQIHRTAQLLEKREA